MLIRDRLPAGIVAALGALLTVPSIIWSTWSMRVTGLGGTDNAFYYEQTLWTWGRIEIVMPADFDRGAPQFPIPWLGFTVHVLIVIAGLAGVAAWLLRRGPHGRLLGAVGVSLIWLRVLEAIVARVSQIELNSPEGGPQFEAVASPAGTMENAALLLLTIALSMMLFRSVVTSALALGRRLRAWAARVRVSEAEEPAPADVAVMRDRDPGPTAMAAEARHAPVGFSEPPPSDPARFRPPKT